jgi:hypothetical protein
VGINLDAGFFGLNTGDGGGCDFVGGCEFFVWFFCGEFVVG